MTTWALVALVAAPLVALAVGWWLGRRGERAAWQRRTAEADGRRAADVAAEEARLRAAQEAIHDDLDALADRARAGDVAGGLDALGVRHRESRPDP